LGSGDGTPAELVLPADVTRVRQAREFVRDRCHSLGFSSDTCDTAILLTSEIVTNALIHGRSEARIRLSVHQRQLRIEVADDNSRHPRLAEQDTDALDGRGLAIVAMLAAAWGVTNETFGKTVWFDVAPA
jgi:anti-sigma regulatory factor (Ser/Thr protein kinase)